MSTTMEVDGYNLTLRTKTPCCGRPVRILALLAIPREIVHRTCRCGQRWTVERRYAGSKELANGQTARVDILEWEKRA